MEEIIVYLKQTFSRNRSDSSFQSIDESMVKYNGRIAQKQYMPLNAIKCG